ncbi:MAG: chemotaxis protein CheV [Oligoflexales bacterium]|nr:chemotaxis protein CheV [Oligoflexales bacterium]
MASGSMFDSLEVGGNVFELIEFSLDRHLVGGKVKTGRYGVNVAKVREVVRMPVINPLASSVPGVAGVFELRGIPIPAINLAKALGDHDAPIKENQQIIVTEFSKKRAGFIVKSTERIRRIAWEKVLPPTADRHTCINGMTLVENNEFLFILDLEKVLLDIEARSGYSSNLSAGSFNTPVNQTAQATTNRSFSNGYHILLIDDSDVILRNTSSFLEREGYQVTQASNGVQAKAILEHSLERASAKPMFDAIITDVEMPKMDGLTLTRWIKGNSKLNLIPVILHTSLSGKANLESGKIVGANAYVVKNDVIMLLKLLKEIRSEFTSYKAAE